MTRGAWRWTEAEGFSSLPVPTEYWLDTAHDGRVLDTIVTGQGLDNIDFLETSQTLYAAKVDNHGKFDLVATVPTVKGARGVVAGEDDRAYLIDPIGGRILEVAPKK